LGGIGTVLGALGWLFRLGYVTKKNNRAADREYQNLDRWVRDQRIEQANALIQSDDEEQIRERFAQQWRDRDSASEWLLEDLHDSEHLGHRLWRKLVGRDWPDNPHVEELALLTLEWKERTNERRDETVRRAKREEDSLVQARDELIGHLSDDPREQERRRQGVRAAMARLLRTSSWFSTSRSWRL
jgi:hypothetical protein